MILIISEDYDLSTSLVIEWLINKNLKFIRLNCKNLSFNISRIHLSSHVFDFELIVHDGSIIRLSEITSVWYRRGFINIGYNEKYLKNNPFSDNLQQHIKNENKTIIDFIYFLLSTKKSLNSPFNHLPNKLSMLYIASSCGLAIPDGVICNKKNNLTMFAGAAFITKAISESIHINKKGFLMYNKIHEVSHSDQTDYSDFFHYSLFQKKISKKYELRIFVLENAFYSAAIFSQQNEDTLIDNRDLGVSSGKIVRIVPYSLPKSIKNKLLTFMQIANYNSGSIDMIVTPDNDYVFLEINPIGQFDYISKLCNFNLEEKISIFLSKKN